MGQGRATWEETGTQREGKTGEEGDHMPMGADRQGGRQEDTEENDIWGTALLPQGPTLVPFTTPGPPPTRKLMQLPLVSWHQVFSTTPGYTFERVSIPTMDSTRPSSLSDALIFRCIYATETHTVQ